MKLWIATDDVEVGQQTWLFSSEPTNVNGTWRNGASEKNDLWAAMVRPITGNTMVQSKAMRALAEEIGIPPRGECWCADLIVHWVEKGVR